MPPLCKGRWHGALHRDGGVADAKPAQESTSQSLSQPDGCQLPLHKEARGAERTLARDRQAGGRRDVSTSSVAAYRRATFSSRRRLSKCAVNPTKGKSFIQRKNVHGRVLPCTFRIRLGFTGLALGQMGFTGLALGQIGVHRPGLGSDWDLPVCLASGGIHRPGLASGGVHRLGLAVGQQCWPWAG